MPNEPAINWHAAFDLLRQQRPGAVAELAQAFPAFDDELRGRRVFGETARTSDGAATRTALGRAALADVAEAVTRSLDEVLAVARRRTRRLARIRFGAGIVALFGGAGVLAALAENAVPTSAFSAGIATAAAALNLFATYQEEQSGGAGSVARLHEGLLEQVGALAEIRGKVAFGLVEADEAAVLTAMGTLAGIAAKLQLARARLGLPLETRTRAARTGAGS